MNKVIATANHDCYTIGDTIATYADYSDADKAATRHNASYLYELGIVCDVI